MEKRKKRKRIYFFMINCSSIVQRFVRGIVGNTMFLCIHKMNCFLNERKLLRLFKELGSHIVLLGRKEASEWTVFEVDNSCSNRNCK
jgi:hypothetical protein